MLKQIREALIYIQERIELIPEVGIVLGNRYDLLLAEIIVEHSLSLSDIPHFPTSKNFANNFLVFGKLNGVQVVLMREYLHFTDGVTMQEIAFPIRVMGMLGIQRLYLANTAKGLNPTYQNGDLMIIDDHINLMGSNPLIGRNMKELGPRFPDMSAPYNLDLIAKAKVIALSMNISCHTGIYAAVSGTIDASNALYPAIETVGADCVGNTIVPEVIIACHMNISVFAISLISDKVELVDEQQHAAEELISKTPPGVEKMTALLLQLITTK